MPITSTICDSYLIELGQGLHNHTVSTGDVFKCALYTSSATLNRSTTTYSSTNEVTGTGYTAGGDTLTNVTPVTSNNVGVYDWADLTFSTLTVSGIRGALIYNSTNSNRAVCTLNFVSDWSPSAKDFVMTFPGATSTSAIIRIKYNG